MPCWGPVVAVGASVGVFVGVGVFVDVGVFVGVDVFIGVGVFVAVGFGPLVDGDVAVAVVVAPVGVWCMGGSCSVCQAR